jgi:hypothetical protein
MKEYYKVKKVSNSSLSWFQQSPKYFKLMLDKEIEEETKSYYEKGEQTHQYILEPEEFDKNYIFLDYETPKSAQQKAFCETYARAKKGTKDEKLIKAYKDAYSTKEVDTKILEKANELAKTYESYIKYTKLSTMYKCVLSNSMNQQLNESRKSLLEHEKGKELMYNENHSTFGNTDSLFIANEFEIYWTYPHTEVECKSMIDRIIIDHENKKVTLVDLKTSSHIAEFKEKFFEYKYYRQMAFYWMAIYWHFKNVLTDKNFDEYIKETFIVVIGTKDPIEVKVFEVTEPTLNIGMLEIHPLIKQLEWHFKEDKWGYTKDYYEGKTTEKI